MSSEEISPPAHVGVIMDGNRRWAIAQGKNKKQGHRAGIDALREIIRSAPLAGVKRLTAYGFSLDNWQREEEEVDNLMELLRNFLQEDLIELHRNGVQLQMLGKRDGVADDILQLIDSAQAKTRNNKGLELVVAFNYGSRDEIVRAALELTNSSTTRGTPLTMADMDKALGKPLDLLIRTGGEQRLSDFMLWQSAYAELMFVDAFWPDFTPTMFLQALADYKKRVRRFGGNG